MTKQLQFDLTRLAPPVDETDLAQLLTILNSAPDWLKAKTLTQMTSFDDRKLRAIASASRGQIISGQRGYRLTRHATIEEIDRCYSALISQSNAMTERALQIQRVYHGHQGVRS